MLETLAQDLRWAWRGLRRRPTFAVTTVLMVGLGIAAATTLFTVVDAVLLEPLALREPERLVSVWSTQPDEGTGLARCSEADVVDWRHHQTRFEGIVTGHNRALTWTGGDETLKLSAIIATHDFFEILGTRAARGRLFSADDLDQQRVLLSHAFWRRHFGTNPNVVGQELTLDGQSHTVIGVLPATFELPRDDVDVYLTRRMIQDRRRGQRAFFTFGRLADGVSLEAAGQEMRVLAADLARQHPENAGWDVVLTPLHDQLTQAVRTPLWVLFGAVGLLLTIVCVNVAGLLLAQTGRRDRELAMCRALGAGRGRIILRLLTESLVLAAAGGGLGILGARGALPLLLRLEPDALPRTHEIALSPSAVLFAWIATALTGVAFGLLPAWRSSATDLVSTLRAGGTGPGHERVRGGLVVIEVALAMVLLLAAGLLGRTFATLERVDPGFEADQLAVVRVFSRPGELRGREKSEYFSELEDALAAAPGVTAVGGGTKVPFSGIGPVLDSPLLSGEHGPDQAAEAPSVSVRAVTPTFLEALGVPLHAGRPFDDHDQADGRDVALVNRALAELIWPGESAVGQVVRLRHGEWKERVVVGVVGDLLQDGPSDQPRPEVYLPHTQHDFYVGLAYAVRTHGPPETRLGDLRRAVLSFDPLQPPHSVTTMALVRDGLVARERFAALLASLFGSFALLLAAIGLYGVIASMVVERRREIGIRMALGARRGQIFGIVQRRAALLVGAGLGLGWIASRGAVPLLESLLFGVTADDPQTLGVAAMVLCAAASAASWIPAREAVRVDPAETLRHE